MKRLLCIAVGFYRTFVSTTAGYRGHWVVGCEYETDQDPTPENVHVIKCRRCGHYDVAWSWESLESVK